MNQTYKTLLVWVLVFMAVFTLWNLLKTKPDQREEFIYSAFIDEVMKGNIYEVSIQGDTINGKTQAGKTFQTLAPYDAAMIKILREHGVRIKAEPAERATELARKMVCEWGMSDKLGPLAFGKKDEQIFLGREIAQHKDYSEQTAVEIDEEIKALVMDNYQKAREIIQNNLEILHTLAANLLEREVLTGEEIDQIIKGV